MDGSQGSFIPKNPVGSVTKKRPVKKLYIVSFLVYAFFVGTLIVAIGTFAFQLTQNQQLASKSAELQSVGAQFDDSVLQRVVALDTKISQAAELLEGYNSIPTLLAAIEAVTVSSVQLTSFNYARGADSQYEVVMAAANPDFNVALFQRQQLADNQVFAGADITDIRYAAGGDDASAGVTFTITNTVTPGSIGYTGTARPAPAPAATPGTVADEDAASSAATGTPATTVTTDTTDEAANAAADSTVPPTTTTISGEADLDAGSNQPTP